MSMVDITKQIPIAIQHVHNTTGDFTTCFEGTGFGETMINPSSEGITFFRPQEMRTAESQIAAFDALHATLSPIGGLNTAIVFADTMTGNLQDGITIAKAIKDIDPKIQTILLALQAHSLFRHQQDVFSASIESEVAEQIIDRKINFVATHEKTIFESRFDRDSELVDKLDEHFMPAAHFDVVVSKFMRWPETFREIAGLPKQSKPARKDWSWNSSAQQAYSERLPELDQWEDLVRQSATNAEWKKFKKQLAARTI